MLGQRLKKFLLMSQLGTNLHLILFGNDTTEDTVENALVENAMSLLCQVFKQTVPLLITHVAGCLQQRDSFL